MNAGLHTALRALVDAPDDTQEWERDGVVHQVEIVTVERILSLLNEFPQPPPGEGEREGLQDVLRSEANRRGERGYVHYATVRNDMRKLADHMDAMAEFGSGPAEPDWKDCGVKPCITCDPRRAALAASPEELDR